LLEAMRLKLERLQHEARLIMAKAIIKEAHGENAQARKLEVRYQREWVAIDAKLEAFAIIEADRLEKLAAAGMLFPQQT
jgi:hypothetical protein